MCGLHGHLAPVHRCASLVCCVAFAVSSATSRQFKDLHARCVVLRVRCPWPLGYRSPVCLLGVLCGRCPRPLCPPSLVCQLGVLCCVSGVLSHFAPVQKFAHLTCCVACAVSLATWLEFIGVPAWCVVCLMSLAVWRLFTGVTARCVVPLVRCPWPLGSRSPVCPLRVPKALLPKGKGRDVYPRVQVNGLGCVCCVRAVYKCVVA